MPLIYTGLEDQDAQFRTSVRSASSRVDGFVSAVTGTVIVATRTALEIRSSPPLGLQ